jgi:hypothetical protein
MGDWPAQQQPALGLLSPQDGEALADMMAHSAIGFNATATTWGTAGRAIYIPVTVPRPLTVYQMAVRVQTQSGNIDVGIYDVAGTRLVANGNVAMAAAGVQTFNITDTLLAPGYYFLAVLCSSLTAALKQQGTTLPTLASRVCGVQMQDTGLDLPATATFAVIASTTIPLVVATYTSATF